MYSFQGMKWDRWIVLIALLLAGTGAGLGLIQLLNRSVWAASQPAADTTGPSAAGDYIVLAWNDLGMHCYNRSFKDLAVLPPFNTLWAQVIRLGDPPTVVTTGLTVEFFFEDNTYSVGKTDFWKYDLKLFGVDLADNVGLKNVGLSGQMTVNGDHFEAVGIPLTEFRDSAPSKPYPYQVATVVVKQQGSGVELARSHPVVPVSSEMHCDYCHYDNGPGNDDIAKGVVEQNILAQHDKEHMDEYPAGHSGPLMNRRPILCAECHASNALEADGVLGIPNLSNAIHEKHDGIVPDSLNGCYNCHPGPSTRCLRDIMASSQHQIYCVDCHGSMLNVAHNPDPWLLEPRCDNERCHGSVYQLDKPLYRMSKDHGGVYCAGCHDSPHAIALSRELNDAIKFVEWQRFPGTLSECSVCHSTWPENPGPHNLLLEPHQFIYLPLLLRGASP